MFVEEVCMFLTADTALLGAEETVFCGRKGCPVTGGLAAVADPHPDGGLATVAHPHPDGGLAALTLMAA